MSLSQFVHTPNADVVAALADELVRCGTLDGAGVDRVIAETIAARSVRLEHIRRDDWAPKVREW
jgi:hypothetical protein